MWYKICKFCENRARDTPLRGVYIPDFGQIWVKISILGSYTLVVAPMGVKCGMEDGTFGPLLHAKFNPHRCNVSRLRGEKPQNWRHVSPMGGEIWHVRSPPPCQISPPSLQRQGCRPPKPKFLLRFDKMWNINAPQGRIPYAIFTRFADFVSRF